MRRPFSLLVLASLGLAAVLPRAAVAHPASFAVMGVRLYMSAPEVLTSLLASGIKPEHVTESVHPCTLHQASACTGAISVRLDGGAKLEIRFTDAPSGFNEGREAVTEVEYTLPHAGPQLARARAPSFEERLDESAEAPNGTWCLRGNDETCRPEEPRMSVSTTSSGAVVMSLSDPGLRSRLAAYAANSEAGNHLSR
jgi:hypothetical protein